MNTRTILGLTATAAAGYWLWKTAAGQNSPSRATPGRPLHPSTRLLGAGGAAIQHFAPIEAMNLYLDGFHPYVDDMGHQMEAHHYCTPLNEDVIQCAIFDGNTRDARLIGVEYIISEELFRTLPEEERSLWHSHHHEVKTGQLIAPGIPEPIEHRLMEKVIRTYGKTWHTWDSCHHDLPVGEPMLMVAFTADGQIRPELVADRDRRFGISTERRRRSREDIAVPPLVPGVHRWDENRVGAKPR